MIITGISITITIIILIKHLVVSRDFHTHEEKLLKIIEEKDDEIERLQLFESAYSHLSTSYAKSQVLMQNSYEAYEILTEKQAKLEEQLKCTKDSQKSPTI